MKNSSLGSLMSMFLLIILSLSCEQKQEIDKPNIVLIMADDLGYRDISSYGNEYINTPNIDKLAAEGLKFTDFHSNGTVCSPTRAALMTGQYQQRTGIEGVVTAENHRDEGLSVDEITIADELSKYGYTCGIFGKWHLGYSTEFNPVNQGFQKFKGYVSGNVDYHSHIDQEGYADWWNSTILSDEKGYSTDLITEYGANFIRKNKDKPFFLYLPHEAPHSPNQGRNSKAFRVIGGKQVKSDIDHDSIPAMYKEMIEVMDEGIGEIMKTLKEEGLADNTIVLFFSDNGGTKRADMGELKGNKGSVYEGGHRVPAIVWWPEKIRQAISSQTVLTMDMLPTMLDLIDQKPSSESIDGISIKEHLLLGKELPPRDLFWATKRQEAIRSGNWKLVVTKSKGKEPETIKLFDLSSDISEQNDLSEGKKELVLELKKKLDNWKTEVRKGVRKKS